MTTFLQAVAKDLYDKLEGNFSRTAIVFPNKRAGLFFNQAIAQLSEKPIWAPVYTTISELFGSLSALTIGDPIRLVAILHRIYCEETQQEEPLDTFYFWGEMLIADFDDLDKHLVDAQKLFSNLSDLRKLMDDHSYLTPEQETALRLFFRNFSIERKTELKELFMQMWDKLGGIYDRFRSELAEKTIAYEGMLYRSVVETADCSSLLYDHYVFVGFNVLNKVEELLFSRLQQAGKAIFYWDYDETYLNNPNHEAGEFIRRNLHRFPNELPHTATLFANMNRPKQVEYIASSTENAQIHHIPQWLRNNLTKPRENETAIVLCNETLLQPMLHTLPPDTVEAVNVTMGYPLSQTPVYSLVNLLLDLYIAGYDPKGGRYSYRKVQPVLRHPYVRQLTPHAEEVEHRLTEGNRFFPMPSEMQVDKMLATIFPTTGATTPVECCSRLLDVLQATASLFHSSEECQTGYQQLYQEALFQTYTKTNRLKSLIIEEDIKIQTGTFCRLMRNMLSALSIPFHGEPAEGLQIMGVLETRNLDFRHLVMLSLNEGLLPKAESNASFIPYNLRKAFGMTTIEHKNAVYAYYFYRLVQRAERITLLYNTSADGLNRGEMSRFMLQYLIEGKQQIQRYALTTDQKLTHRGDIVIPGSPVIADRLKKRFGDSKNLLSPTALNTYMDCTLKFFFRYVCNLREEDNVSASIENSDFGNIFHATCEIIYKEVLESRQGMIRRQDIEALLEDDMRLHECVGRAFKALFFKIPNDKRAEYNGLQLLNREMLVTYVRQLLRRDAERAPFRFLGAEHTVYKELTIHPKDNRAPFTLKIGGTIDRIDEKEGTVRIVDYKTGHRQQKVRTISELFDPAKKERAYHIFQTLLYASILAEKTTKPVSPALFYVQLSASPEYSPTIQLANEPITDITTCDGEFKSLLEKLLDEMFSAQTTFKQTTNEHHCTHCPYRTICGINVKKKE